ncbi:helix-turn-helix domain-containing protein [Nonomuraea longispora]|uniref:helix-turn-helix domain-containing protein n=1 Tax=Nonomuraea longispora TaxID=1848320 RepID=UPI001C708B83|nr:AraC family transcriptional regulator [Nonomuraea longispora]
MKLIVIRTGSAILYSEFGERPVKPGDVVLLGANALCGSEPEGHVTVTTIYADADFLLDQLYRRFTPLRAEARQVRDALQRDIARSWGLPEPAGMVHLSTKQLSRVFVNAYGKPLTYLTMPRVEEMARLLRETDLTIEQAGRPVSRRSRNRASSAFRECVGITPSRYRAMRSVGGMVPTFETPVPT